MSSSTDAIIVPTPQRTVWRICTETYSAIITTLPPPSSAGVTKKPREKMKTRTPAAAIPGRLSGRKIRRNVVSGPAPSERDASASRGSMPCMLA